MANIVGLNDTKNKNKDEGAGADEDDDQKFYVGGAGSQGGSGLNHIICGGSHLSSRMRVSFESRNGMCGLPLGSVSAATTFPRADSD